MTEIARMIDSDAHPLLADGIRSLYPYMTRAWRVQLEHRERIMPPVSRLLHGGGHSLRKDSTPPGGGPPGSDPEFAREDLLDKWNLSYALLLSPQAATVNISTYAAEAKVLATAYNQYFLDHWIDADDRFRLGMVVAPQDPIAAAAEIRRVADPRRIAAVWVPHVNILAGNVYYHPIYEAAEEVGLPIVDHPISSSAQYQGAETFAGGVPSTHPEWVCGMPQIALSSMTSLIFEGVFEKFPRLKYLFAEYGWAWAPGYIWRMDSFWRNLRADVPWLRRAPSEYILDHIRFTTQPLPEPPNSAYLDAIIDMLGEGRTLLGSTDYPHYDADDPPAIARSFPEELRDRILFQNAAEFFGPELMPIRETQLTA